MKAEKVYTSTGYIDNTVKRLATNDPITFRQKCGTHFIKAIVLGGEYSAVLSHAAKSQEEQKEFSAALSASVNAYQGDVSAKNTFESSGFFSTTKIVGFKAGGSSLTPLEPSTLRSDFQSMRNDVDNGKLVPVFVVLQHYPDSLPKLDLKMAGLDKAYFILAIYKDVLSSFDSLQEHPELYFVEPSSVQSIVPIARPKLESLRTQLISKMNECSKSEGDNVKVKCDFDSTRRPSFPGPSYGLPMLYKEICASSVQPPPYTGNHFENMPHTSSDHSMGGYDVIQIGTCYNFVKGGNINQVLQVRGVETVPNQSRFQNVPLARTVWKGDEHPGCVVTSSMSLGVCKPDGTPDLDAGPARATPQYAHNYTPLSFNEKFIADAVCRTNKPGTDDNFVGCNHITFLPIPISLEHEELMDGQSKPNMSLPSWLN